MMWRWDDGMNGWWAMGIGWLLWIVITVAVVWFVVRAWNVRARGDGAESAEEVLRRRYAAGEIDDQEYERRLAVLHRH